MHNSTLCASAERSAPEDVAAQTAAVRAQSGMALVDAIRSAVVLLNEDRQIVAANPAFVALAEAESEADLLGLRLGEVLGCVNASSMPAGCGTSAACRACGAMRSILEAQAGSASGHIAHVTAKTAEGAERGGDFYVWASPVRIGEQRLLALSVSEAGDSVRKQMLEQALLADVGRIANELAGMARLSGIDLAAPVASAARRLDWVVQRHAVLMAAEGGSLTPAPAPVSSLALLRSAAAICPEGSVRLEEGSADVPLVLDPELARHVLAHMLLNAVEAAMPAELVEAGVKRCDGTVEFWASNVIAIPPELRPLIFRRSASGKGPGRGTGTYVMRLVAERYLGGTVRFATGKVGTTFTISFRCE